MKTCYTVILGGYDTLRNPTVITPGWRYVCITDTPEICEGTVYEALFVSVSANIGELEAKYFKWLLPAHHKYDGENEKLIYHDGNFQVIGNLDEYIKPFEDAAFATRLHPSRTNLIEETQACLDLGKISAETAAFVLMQLDDMDELPNGLWENGLLYFNSAASDFTEWGSHFWHLFQMLDHTTRDQILLPMVLDNEIEPALIDRTHAANFFKYHKTHLK